MRMIVAHERTSTRAAVIGNRRSSIRPHDTQIEVDQALASHIRRARPHAVRGVANRATEAMVEVPRMLRPARIILDLVL